MLEGGNVVILPLEHVLNKVNKMNKRNQKIITWPMYRTYFSIENLFEMV